MQNLPYLSERYREHLAFLIDYASEDWLGFSVVSPRATGLIGRESTLEQRLIILLQIVSDPLDAGAKIGDFAVSEGAPFVGWSGTKKENLAKMETEIRKLGKMPMSGDVGWITFLDH
jgi:hypothetical protein